MSHPGISVSRGAVRKTAGKKACFNMVSMGMQVSKSVKKFPITAYAFNPPPLHFLVENNETDTFCYLLNKIPFFIINT